MAVLKSVYAIVASQVTLDAIDTFGEQWNKK